MLPQDSNQEEPITVEFRIMKSPKETYVEEVKERKLYSLQQERKKAILQERRERTERARMTPI